MKTSKVKGNRESNYMTEREKLKGMTFKEKREYIWEYYKLFIIGFFVVVVVGGLLLNSLVINPPPKNYLGIAYLGDYMTEDILADLSDQLTDKIIPEDLRADNIIDQENFYETDDPTLGTALQSKFVALISTGDLNVIVSDDDNFDGCYTQELLIPLDSLIDTSKIEDARLYKQDGQVYGIRIASSSPLTKYGLGYTTVGITTTTKDASINDAVTALEILIGD